MTKTALTEQEIRLWILNDERLYNWYRAERGDADVYTFIRANRLALERAIERTRDRVTPKP
jgi:hypothetical protein